MWEMRGRLKKSQSHRKSAMGITAASSRSCLLDPSILLPPTYVPSLTTIPLIYYRGCELSRAQTAL